MHGEIVEKASPSMEHSATQFALAGWLQRRFGRGSGGSWPGGWWSGTEVHVEYETHELFCHDAVGWRRERAPIRPAGWPVRLRPDWVAEILSPSKERRDVVEKFRVLQRAGVPHYWLVAPEEKTLVVHRLDASGYLVVLTAGAGEAVRAEPFEHIELRLDVLFGDADDD